MNHLKNNTYFMDKKYSSAICCTARDTILKSLHLICIIQLVVTLNNWSIQGTVFLLIVLLRNGYL